MLVGFYELLADDPEVNASPSFFMFPNLLKVFIVFFFN
jgi:hypothetical protein